MMWKPTKLTREQLEERRLEGGRLMKVGKLSQVEGAIRGEQTIRMLQHLQRHVSGKIILI